MGNDTRSGAVPLWLVYPGAAQSEIVRLHQKDAYYRGQFYEQLKEVAVDLLGTRRGHLYEEALALVASLAYFGLCTLGSAQSLGEEYVNVLMRSRPRGTIVSPRRRAFFLFLYVFGPYLLTRMYGFVRKRIILKEKGISQRSQSELLQRQDAEKTGEIQLDAPEPGIRRRTDALIQWLAANLPGSHVLTAADGWFAHAAAAQLALFYLFGRYYTLAHRAARVDYLYASARRPNSRPLSYEILGVLLGIQLVVRFALALRRLAPGASSKKDIPNPSYSARPDNAVQLDNFFVTPSNGSVICPPNKSSACVPLHYPDPDAAVTPEELGLSLKTAADKQKFDAVQTALRTKTTQLEAIANEVLRCTLCMDTRVPEKGTSAVTECGHVFCWDCITEWAQEKPECPLCRQALSCSRLVPVYNL